MPDGNTYPAAKKASTKRQLAQLATREKVLDAAGVCFSTLGYERATIRDIASTAGLSTGAVFSNFSGKVELYTLVHGHAPISPEVGRAILARLQSLTAMARTSGGTAGPDAGLQDACSRAEEILTEIGAA